MSTSSSSAQPTKNEDANELIVTGNDGTSSQGWTRVGGSDTHTQPPVVVDSIDIVALDDDDDEKEVEEEMTGSGKRQKRRTSIVWKYFYQENCGSGGGWQEV